MKDETRNYEKYGTLAKLSRKQQKDYQRVYQEYQLQNPRIVKDSSMAAGQKVTWDCVWFGSYPQSEVSKDSEVYAKLVNAVKWDRNDDIAINGTKYRRVKRKEKNHYFQYEPIKWRVLKVENGKAFLLADIVLDIQKYYSKVEFDIVVWEKSTIRNWLNSYFIDVAFSSLEQEIIVKSVVVNENNLKWGKNTEDKLFLLSKPEVCSKKVAKSYGFVHQDFVKDEARKSKNSNYASRMECNKNEWGSSWLRSPGYYMNNEKGYVSHYGFVYKYGLCAYNFTNGVRPALNLNLSSSHLYSYAGTVCSDGTIDEVVQK